MQINHEKSGVFFASELNNNKEETFSPQDVAITALNSLPPVRRTFNVPEEVEEKDYWRAFGLVGIMLANLPEDFRDIKEGFRQVGHWLTGDTYIPSYNYKKYQHEFSFFRGTFLEPVLDIQKGNKKGIGLKLYGFDEPVYNTKIGQKIIKFLGIEESGFMETSRKDRLGANVMAHSFETKGIKGHIARAMLRMPKITLIALGLLELPTVIKTFYETEENKTWEGTKQLFKSLASVLLIQGCIGLGGAIGFNKFGATTALVGMGAGSLIGSYASKKMDEYV